MPIEDLVREIQHGDVLLDEGIPIDLALDGVRPTVAALLKKSTDSLDEATRDCFASLGAFAPQPATFDLDAMRAVWEIADPKPIVRKLVGRGLLQPLGRERFRMHAVLVMHARSLLEQ